MSSSMTIEELARYLQYSEEKVCDLIRDGQIVAAKDNHDRLAVAWTDLERYLVSHHDDAELRRAVFEAVLHSHEQNTDVDGDALLEELEAEDEQRKPQRANLR